MSSLLEEDIQTLVKLGLTSSQARIYLTLIALEYATVKTIAQSARMDRGETYRLLPALLEKGLLEKVLTTPTKYKPIPLNNGLSILVRQANIENVQLRKKTKELLKKYENKPRAAKKEEENQFIIFPKEEIYVRHVRKVWANTRINVIGITPLKRFPLSTSTYAEDVKKSLSRGTQVRAITELPQERSYKNYIKKYLGKFREIPGGFTLRFSQSPINIAYSIYDNKTLLLFTTKPEGLADQLVLQSRNPAMIEVFGSYFEMIWRTATEYRQLEKDLNT